MNADYTDMINSVVEQIRTLLAEKRKEYGDSVFIPTGIFTNHLTGEKEIDSILYRLDDKLARVKNTENLREDDVLDIIGYLILLEVSMRLAYGNSNR